MSRCQLLVLGLLVVALVLAARVLDTSQENSLRADRDQLATQVADLENTVGSLREDLNALNWDVCSALWAWAAASDYRRDEMRLVEYLELQFDYWLEESEYHDGFCYWG